MNDDTAMAIVRAAAALVKPGASPIIENLELVQDMAESALAYVQSHDVPVKLASGALVVCGNCGWRGYSSACNSIADVLDRVMPGEIMPHGECPECEALCHDAAQAPDVLADLYSGFRWLVDEMGMEPELAGGGCVQLRHAGPAGSYVLVTDGGGSGLPLPDSWCVGAYPPFRDDDVAEAMLLLYATDRPSPMARPLTLRQAVQAACSVIAEY